MQLYTTQLVWLMQVVMMLWWLHYQSTAPGC